jgi:hypothetical protein
MEQSNNRQHQVNLFFVLAHKIVFTYGGSIYRIPSQSWPVVSGFGLKLDTTPILRENARFIGRILEEYWKNVERMLEYLEMRCTLSVYVESN